MRRRSRPTQPRRPLLRTQPRLHPKPRATHPKPRATHPKPRATHPKPRVTHPKPRATHPNLRATHRKPRDLPRRTQLIRRPHLPRGQLAITRRQARPRPRATTPLPNQRRQTRLWSCTAALRPVPDLPATPRLRFPPHPRAWPPMRPRWQWPPARTSSFLSRRVAGYLVAAMAVTASSNSQAPSQVSSVE